MYKHTNHRGRSSPRALWVRESKALPIDNMCIYAKNIEIILYNYEVEKIFQYGGKKNHFMHSDIILNSESFTCTNFMFGNNCLWCKMSNKHTQTYLF